MHIIIIIFLCSLYAFCLFILFSYYGYKKHIGIIKLFLTSFIFNLPNIFFIKKRLFLISIFVIAINLILAIIIVIIQENRVIYSLNIFQFIERVVFYLLLLFVSGNWLLPFIVFSFNKTRKYLKKEEKKSK